MLKPGAALLREAEPWIGQATLRFYPDIYRLDGWRTELPNLLYARLVSRSWIARGRAQGSPELALQNFRREIRLGRLLHQEDLAEQRADRRLPQAEAIVLGEIAPQRLRTAERLTRIELKAPEDDRRPGDGWPLSRQAAQALSDRQLEGLVAEARSAPDRRFRIAAVLQLNFVRSLGTSSMRQKARAALAGLAAAKDPILAQFAAWGRDTDISPLL